MLSPLSRLKLWARRALPLGAVLLVTGTIGALADTTPVVYSGCQNVATGALRLLPNSLAAPYNNCILAGNPVLISAPNLVETKVFWNQVGPQGIQGPAGPQGVKGDTGAQGPQGTAGPAGVVGPQGIKGDTGAQGLPGVKGDIGATGAIGATGETGASGPLGPQGQQGSAGTPGSQGPVGPAGPPGPSGTVNAPPQSYWAFANNVPMPAGTSERAAQTGFVAAGTYIITGTALFDLVTGDSGFCFLGSGRGATSYVRGGGGEAHNSVTATVIDRLVLYQGDIIILRCNTTGTGTTDSIVNAFITAIQVTG